MKFILSGWATILTAAAVEDIAGEQPDESDWQEHKVTVEAPSKSAALTTHYSQCGDGYWLPNGTYLLWREKPQVSLVPLDQQLASLPPEIAPRLPGFVL